MEVDTGTGPGPILIGALLAFLLFGVNLSLAARKGQTSCSEASQSPFAITQWQASDVVHKSIYLVVCVEIVGIGFITHGVWSALVTRGGSDSSWLDYTVTVPAMIVINSTVALIAQVVFLSTFHRGHQEGLPYSFRLASTAAIAFLFAFCQFGSSVAAAVLFAHQTRSANIELPTGPLAIAIVSHLTVFLVRPSDTLQIVL
ncbi:hypothetical protein BKA70DRAFT_1346310 [Coprinopsis sp. MPI-PUGE-AT-0042]|nr:hypothetical protein BKA70DRAFT_1346310 [Coprinopsis sp. MPI-PUGE-AT-0042]